MRHLPGCVLPATVALASALVDTAPDAPLAVGPEAKVLEPVRGAAIPKGLKVSARVEPSECYLGENPLIHYTVENAGDVSFKIDVGSDYRGAPRALRFSVRAVDKDGKTVPDPYARVDCMGGLGTRPAVPPGETYTLSTPLMQHCWFEAPGEYTIEITHDLGWLPAEMHGLTANAATQARADTQATALTARATIKIREPDPATAEKLMKRLGSMKRESGTWGKPLAAHGDFSVLRHPVYLPILVDWVDRGAPDAIAGINSIRSPAATAALITLLGHKDVKKATDAAAAIQSRLPSRHLWNAIAIGQPWKDDLAPALRRGALAMLTREEESLYYPAGAFLARVAEKEDLPAIARTVTAALKRHADPVDEKGNYLDPPGTTRMLIEAMQRCVARGAAVSEEPKDLAGIALYCAELARSREFRPSGWDNRLAGWLRDEHPFARRWALTCAPSPLPEPCRKLLPALLEDADAGVRMQAATRVAAEKDAASGPAVLKLLRSAKGTFVLSAAQNAAVALNLLPEAAEILVDRLDERDVAHATFMFLAQTVEGGSGSGGGGAMTDAELASVSARWKSALTTYREALHQGKKIPVGPGGIDETFFPHSVTITVNGKPYPARK